ncbi:Cysteine dioxygenase CDG1 [Candida viswanathii]|uniref:Cysteine dioxygenase n=1 Tax=Candida viswanathii TaxID=5486 RepID=A0A367YK91_9ASCO|nr:Cysteine dioxygenase CDG1 [Candida viswanathii]
MLLNPSSLIPDPTATSTTPNAPRSCPVSSLLPEQDHGCEINGNTIDCIPTDSPFFKLISDLKQLLSGKGLSSEDIDITQVQKLMDDYVSDESDWLHLALHDMSRNYSRNGIINLNGNANLLILVWSPGKSSAIHDHADAHCCMKILAGELVEHLYDAPDHEGEKLTVKKETTLRRDEVGYINDSIGLHKISNPLSDKVSVSLHLYTPPYAALYGCSMYESGTGKKHHVDMSKYYSWQGKLIHDRDSLTC